MSTQTDLSPEQGDDKGYDLLLYGQEEVLRASEMAVLAAFAALAYQQLREEKGPFAGVASALLLVSVFLCAVVHFFLGTVFVGRGRRLIRKQEETRKHKIVRGVQITLA